MLSAHVPRISVRWHSSHMALFRSMIYPPGHARKHAMTATTSWDARARARAQSPGSSLGVSIGGSDGPKRLISGHEREPILRSPWRR
jgi:hypothetical protein